jgi:hypothetical protein
MRNRKKAIVGMLGLFVAATTTFADIHNGQMVQNPFFTVDKSGWSTGGQWRPNGAANLVHDFTTTASAGFSSAVGATRDLTLDAAITADPLYDANTTKLTDLSFGNVWLLIPNWNVGNIGANMDARFYVEVDITTLSGNEYRAASNQVVVDDTMQTGGYAQAFSINSWATYATFDGNPFDGGDGIALGDIDTVNYKWVMQTITPNADGAGTVFFQADNATLNYEVTTVPEPATLGLVTAFGTGIFWIRRKFMI